MDNSFDNCDRAQESLGNHRLDNGMSRSSISFKNQGFDVSKPGLVKTSGDIDGSVKSRQQPPTTAKANPELSQLEQSVISALSHNRFAATAVRQGTLEKCKLTENGPFAVYKDQKSAEKMGKHYPAPTDVCDLRGAILSYAEKDKQKDKRRKHIISLALTTKTDYLFSCAGNEAEINGWFHALRQTISTLPAIVQPSLSDYGGSLPRCTSNSSMRSKGLNTNFKGSPFSKTSLQQSVKSKLKSSGSRTMFTTALPTLQTS
uniref:PH domain-containing protein n=1 Tax=Ditylenchus dipsaci TaxID=166011 RepID=A0A915D4R0_9BILA